MSPELSVGVAGLGYWGPNVLRNLRAVEGCRVGAIADTDQKRLSDASRLYPDVACFASAEQMITDPSIEAVVLALPASMLPDLAILAAQAGKHILVEKPMAPSLEQGIRMVSTRCHTWQARMVDFTFVYSPAVRYLASLLQSSELGVPLYYQSTRINLGRFQPDVDVILDLVVHDVAILTYLLGQAPISAMATGRGIQHARVDTANVTLTYQDGFQAFIHVSWMAPTKVRMALLACDQGMVAYNDVEPDEKIRVYRFEDRFDPGKEDAIVPTFRLGDVTIPRLPQEEPLRAMGSTFINSAIMGDPPITDWAFGLEVLATLDAARESLRTGRAAPVRSGALTNE